jgi:hypothetical protein
MSRLAVSQCALGISVAAALLAGCGGAQLPISASAMLQSGATTSRAARLYPYKASPPLLYVTDPSVNDNDVKVYRADARNPSPLGVISSGVGTPSADCLDKEGTLYVTNQPASGAGWISEYSPWKDEAV